MAQEYNKYSSPTIIVKSTLLLTFNIFGKLRPRFYSTNVFFFETFKKVIFHPVTPYKFFGKRFL